MKATEQYFPVVLFIMLYKVVLTFESVDEILKGDHQNEATEQYFLVMLIKVVITFALPVNEILYESCWVTVSFDTLCQMKFRNINSNCPVDDLKTPEKNWRRLAPLKMWSCKTCGARKYFFHFQFVANLMMKIRKNLGRFTGHGLLLNQLKSYLFLIKFLDSCLY